MTTSEEEEQIDNDESPSSSVGKKSSSSSQDENTKLDDCSNKEEETTNNHDNTDLKDDEYEKMIGELDRRVSEYIHKLDWKPLEIFLLPFATAFQPFLCWTWALIIYCVHLALSIRTIRESHTLS